MHHVLVIDDEEAITSLLKIALTGAGFKVDVASNGVEGIEKYDKSNFDVVITDIKMPELSGKGVVQYIRKSSKPNTPVVGISGTPWELSEDFDAVLPKPFSLKKLFSTVQDVC